MPRTLPRPAKVRRVTLVDRIAHRIHEIRGHRVMLDSDLADLYGVETRVLVQGVKRNIARFPKDFLFQLTRPEFHRLRSQFVISNGRGGLRRPPYAFTEHGAVMLASVLNSPVAVATSVHVVRAFLRLRQIAVKYKELARKV
ncbi:MAG: ORF6N domain-containing protein, partial [Planctomycetes bacterium]|nr:ORF6N domain-containing protein [Planctomycetota bacterium]